MQKLMVERKGVEKCVPSRAELKALTGYRTYSGAAKVLGISHTAVRKWFTMGMSEKNYKKHFGSLNETFKQDN